MVIQHALIPSIGIFAARITRHAPACAKSKFAEKSGTRANIYDAAKAR
jgi:hypothetical protein